jgi:hypothetical protein
LHTAYTLYSCTTVSIVPQALIRWHCRVVKPRYHHIGSHANMIGHACGMFRVAQPSGAMQCVEARQCTQRRSIWPSSRLMKEQSGQLMSGTCTYQDRHVAPGCNQQLASNLAHYQTSCKSHKVLHHQNVMYRAFLHFRSATGKRNHQFWEPQLDPPPLLAEVILQLVFKNLKSLLQHSSICMLTLILQLLWCAGVSCPYQST